MKLMLERARLPEYGFAVPTIVIASVVMITVLVATVGASASVRASLDSQYYNGLARQAGEAGRARVQDCMNRNSYIAQWSNANPLRPNTTCTGGAACSGSSNCYVIQNAKVRTSFEVPATTVASGFQNVVVIGKVELLTKSGGNVWRTHTKTTVLRLGANFSFDSLAFGYSDWGAHYLAMGNSRVVTGVGSNNFGQLGNGTTTDTLTPKTIPFNYLALQPVAIYAQPYSLGWNTFVKALASSGTYEVWGAGKNDVGQLGNGSTAPTQTTPVKFILPPGVNALHVALIGRATFVTTPTGRVYAAGDCSNGLLGTNYVISGCSNASTPLFVALPTPDVSDLNTMPTNNIALDMYTAYLRMQGGRVYGWGQNQFGQLAQGNTSSSSVPLKIGLYGDAGYPKALQVETDSIAVYILDDTGAVNSAGYNDRGQFGDGTTNGSYTLRTFIMPDIGAKGVKIATDEYSLLVMTDRGDVWGTGANDRGQLGNGTTGLVTANAQKFILPAGVKAVDMCHAARGFGFIYANTFVIGDDGNVYGAGSNAFGQIGNSSATDPQTTPLRMELPAGVRAKSCYTGYGTAAVMTEDSKVYTVGNNSNGQLGDGTTVNSSVPRANKFTNAQPVVSF